MERASTFQQKGELSATFQSTQVALVGAPGLGLCISHLMDKDKYIQK